MTQTRNIVRCPKCGFTFDISYGRTFACGPCPSIVQCSMAECPKCRHEFSMPGRERQTFGNMKQKFE